MFGTDMVLGWLEGDTGRGRVADYWSAGHGRPALDPAQHDITHARVAYADGRTRVRYRRRLRPKASHAAFDTTLPRDQLLDLCYAWGGRTLRPAGVQHVFFHTVLRKNNLTRAINLSSCPNNSATRSPTATPTRAPTPKRACENDDAQLVNLTGWLDCATAEAYGPRFGSFAPHQAQTMDIAL